jgi:PAB-dependent poly(A)-specific ribonuclease subunit 2
MYAGLENNILNCYANPLLQMLYFTTSVRNLALRHTAGPCRDPDCMTCELGYVFDMLQKSEGRACQGTNLLRTLSGLNTGKAVLATLIGVAVLSPSQLMA